MKRSIGFSGERLAKEELKKLGYSIIKENYLCPLGEIDLIAWKDKTLVFIEVRSRMSTDYGLPLETINRKKQQKIKQVASYYLVTNKKEDSFCRFDVVSIVWGKEGSKPSIEIIRDAFS